MGRKRNRNAPRGWRRHRLNRLEHSEKIKTIHENSRKTYGNARVHAVLLEDNESSSRPRVASIMRELELQGKRQGTVKQKPTDSKHSHTIAENKLERKFDAQKPNRSWVPDLTCIPTLKGWLFLAIVMDLLSSCNTRGA